MPVPAPGCRWSPARKRALLDALDSGSVSAESARQTYALTEEEIDSWRRRLARFGAAGLAVHRLQELGR